MHPLALASSLAVAGFLLAGCGGPEGQSRTPATTIDRAHARFLQHLDGCTQSAGSDPRTAAVGDTELAPGERQWRECAYEGLRSIMMPASANPDQYVRLISEDRAMTEQIAAGTLTRSARQARLDQRRSEIESQEAADVEQQTENQKMQQVINGLR